MLLEERQDRWSARYERLLVGERDVLAGLDGLNSWQQTRTPHNARHHHVRLAVPGHLDEALVAHTKLGHLAFPVGEESLEVAKRLVASDRHDFRIKFLNLLRKQLDVAARSQALDLEPVWEIVDDVKRLRSDRACGPEQRNFLLPCLTLRCTVDRIL